MNKILKKVIDRDQFEVVKWSKDKNGKSFPVEYEAKGGAKVHIDIGHDHKGPNIPHVGYQTAGTHSQGGRKRGNIFMDEVPVNRLPDKS